MASRHAAYAATRTEVGYSGEKVRNRDATVWHGGRQKMALGRGAKPAPRTPCGGGDSHEGRAAEMKTYVLLGSLHPTPRQLHPTGRERMG